MEFVLVLLAARYGDAAVVIPARYPTQQECRGAGESYVAQGNSSHRFACIPVPRPGQDCRPIPDGRGGFLTLCVETK